MSDILDSQNAIGRRASRDRREIGPLPPVVNQPRKDAAEASLRVFLETYFPTTFCIAWSDDHLAMIDRLEECIRRGGLYAVAMPRGSGKTSCATRAALWALLFGFRQFVVFLAATQHAAEKIIAAARVELQHNDLLAEDFPEACYPIRELEGITKRQQGQLLDDEPTNVKLSAAEVVFPSVEAS